MGSGAAAYTATEAKYYRQMADECFVTASQCSGKARESLLYLAQDYVDMADDAERRAREVVLESESHDGRSLSE